MDPRLAFAATVLGILGGLAAVFGFGKFVLKRYTEYKQDRKAMLERIEELQSRLPKEGGDKSA